MIGDWRNEWLWSNGRPRREIQWLYLIWRGDRPASYLTQSYARRRLQMAKEPRRFHRFHIMREMGHCLDRWLVLQRREARCRGSRHRQRCRIAPARGMV